MIYFKKGDDYLLKNFDLNWLMFIGYLINFILLLCFTFDVFASRTFEVLLAFLLVLNAVFLLILSRLNYKASKWMKSFFVNSKNIWGVLRIS